MKLRNLLGWMLAAFAIVACKKEEVIPVDPEANSVTLSVKYGETTEGVAKPENVILTIDNEEMAVAGGKFDKTDLEAKDSYLISVYNKVDKVSVADGIISIEGAGGTVPSIDWMFCYAGEKKIDKSLGVTLQQQTKQINIVVRALGGKIAAVSEVTAELTEVAGQRDLINKVYKNSSTVAAGMENGVLTGTFFGTHRVLGFMTDAASTLNLNFKYNDGTSSTTTVDISSHTEGFNDDKTVINVISVGISELGTDNEVVTSEVTNDGTLENKDNTDAAAEGTQKMTINWPSYNTASRIEVKADGKYYVGELEAATEAGQVTKNGFAELPAADKIEEIAIYVGAERLIAPAGYYTYAEGVITMIDCKLVYKPEHMNDTYITPEGTFVQTTNIALPSEFAPIGAEWNFAGTYDGQGFTITGINSAEAKSDFGLFRANAGTIKNIVIKDSKMVTGDNCGFIVAHNSGTILNCISYGEIESTGSYSGGIAGRNYANARISRCQFHGILKSDVKGNCGGIVALSDKNTIIEYCLNTASLSFPLKGGYLGGIAGLNRGIVRGCKNTGNHVFFKGSQWTGNGGVIGRNESPGQIIACVNTGNISGLEGFGGMLGVNQSAGSKVTASYSTGLVIDAGSAGFVGKVVGWFAGRNASADIEYCYCVSEGQPKTSNGVFGNGNKEKVDIQKFEEAWPTEDATKGWGIYTEGCDPTQGYYWKTLGSAESKTYPVLFWEE